MSENVENVDLSKLSSAELKKILARKEKSEKEARQKELAAYDEEKNEKISKLMERAYALSVALEEFKKECHTTFDEQSEALERYGMIRSNSKGGFSITSKNGSMRITRIRSTEPFWDEKSIKAVDLIKDFLYSTVKKRNKKLFEILISFIEKNKNGDLEYSRVMSLVQHEDKYDDPRWKEGLQLIKESYNNRLKGFGYEFKEVDPESKKWKHLNLNFSSI